MSVGRLVNSELTLLMSNRHPHVSLAILGLGLGSDIGFLRGMIYRMCMHMYSHVHVSNVSGESRQL